MEKRVIPTVENPKITIEVRGDLTLKGWDEGEVVVRNHSSEDLSIEQQGQAIKIECRSNCTLRVPFDSSIEIQSVGGNAILKSLEGESIIREVMGDLTLRGTGPVTIERIHGNFAAKNVDGDLKVDSVFGSAAVRDVQGDFIVEDRVHSNLTLRDLDGDARAAALGSLILSLDPSPGNS
jgi:hypothetical protein